MKPLFTFAVLAVIVATTMGATMDGDCPGTCAKDLEEGSDLDKLYKCLCEIIDADPPCLPAEIVKALRTVKDAGKLKVATPKQVACELADREMPGLREAAKTANEIAPGSYPDSLLEKQHKELKVKYAPQGSSEGLTGKNCVTFVLLPTLSNPYRKKAAMVHEGTHLIQQNSKDWSDPGGRTGGSGTNSGGGGGSSTPAVSTTTPGWGLYQELGAESAALKYLLDQAAKNASSSDPEKAAKAAQIKAAIKSSKGLLGTSIGLMCTFLKTNADSPHATAFTTCKNDAKKVVAKADAWLAANAEAGEKNK